MMMMIICVVGGVKEGEQGLCAYAWKGDVLKLLSCIQLFASNHVGCEVLTPTNFLTCGTNQLT